MTEEGEWLAVGRKGRPRRTPSQQHRHLAERARAAASLSPVGSPGNADSALPQQPPVCTAVQPLPARQPSPPLPGWGPPPEREWRVAQGSRARRARKGYAPPASPEAQVKALASQVQELAAELAGSKVYAALVSAMQQACRGPADWQHQQPQEQQQPPSVQQGQPQQQPPPPPPQQQQDAVAWAWEAVHELVVYGLGTPEDERNARHQLAMVLLLRRLLPGLARPPLLYDPAFTDVDRALLAALGCEVLPSNEAGARRVGCRTLFYLPHCPGSLCDSLLAANWSERQLRQLAIYGNCFSAYRERWSAPPGARPNATRPAHMLHLLDAGGVRELAVPDHGYRVLSAFNEGALHLFDSVCAEQLAGLAAGGGESEAPRR